MGPVHRAVCLFTSQRWSQYQLVLLGDRGTCVWTTCLRSLPGSVPVRSWTCTSELPQDYKSDTLPLDYRATHWLPNWEKLFGPPYILILYVLCWDGARCEVYENGGVERLAKLLTAQLTIETDASKTLPRIACGFLFNLVNTHGLCLLCHLRMVFFCSFVVITSAKEVMFLPDFVCLSVCVSPR